jgi:hypothetical protein
MTWDVKLPPAPVDLPFYLDCETHSIFQKFENSTGDTLYICCRYNSTTGNWDSSELETYSENKAEEWFNSLYRDNGLYERQQEEDREWAELYDKELEEE